MNEVESKRQRDMKACNECSPGENPPISQLSGPLSITSLRGAGQRDHSITTAAIKEGGIAMTLSLSLSTQPRQIRLDSWISTLFKLTSSPSQQKITYHTYPNKTAYINYTRKVMEVKILHFRSFEVII